MKTIGTPLSNQELLNLKGGIGFSCICFESGLEYVPNLPPNATLADALATLDDRCDGGPGFCESDSNPN